MVNRIRKALAEKDQGFTLIELLVVIIIIGILAAIAIPVFLNQRKKGVDAGLKSDLKNAATAAETYSTDNPSATSFGADAAATRTNLVNAGFKATTGNTVKVTGSPLAGYRLCAFADGASNATGAATALAYDSAAGGLSGSTDCSAATWHTIS